MNNDLEIIDFVPPDESEDPQSGEGGDADSQANSQAVASDAEDASVASSSDDRHKEQQATPPLKKETKNPRSPKGHGQGECIICNQQFQKSTANHKICANSACQEQKEINRAKQKRLLNSIREKKRKAEKLAREATAAQEKAAAQEKRNSGKRKSAPPASHSSGASQKRRTNESSHPVRSANTRLSNSNLQEHRHEASNPAKKPNAPWLKSGNAARPRHGTDGDIGASGLTENCDRFTATLRTYQTKGTQDQREPAGLMLDWKGNTQKMLNRGYQILNFKVDHKAANMNIHCELMQQVAGTGWQSRVRQGWEDGQHLKLEAIQNDSHKMENLHMCKQLIELCKSALNRISKEMYKLKAKKAGQTKEATSPEVTKHHGEQVIEVSYVVHQPGKHKHEFVHADSVVQGDLMAIMPLVDHSVQPKFYPYHRMEASRQGPIARDHEDFQGKNVKRMIETITDRFYPLAGTCTGASRLHDALCTTSRVQRGDLLVYLGDALHAFPEGDRKKHEPFLYFKGRLADCPEPKGAGLANDAPADPALSEIKGGAAKAPDKQAPTVAGDSLTSKVDGKSIDNVAPDPGGTGTVVPLAKAASNQDETAESKTAVSVKDPDLGDSKGGTAKAPSEHAKAASSKDTKDAKDVPDRHGVVDALVVLQYSDEDLLDWAAVHNLIAAGYLTSKEAVGVYKKRYPQADEKQTTAFEKKFLEECNRKENSAKLLLLKLPTHLDI
jgi:hypothetical protein